MATSDEIQQLKLLVMQLEARIRELERQKGPDYVRISNRQGGGGGIRWTEYTGP